MDLKQIMDVFFKRNGKQFAIYKRSTHLFPKQLISISLGLVSKTSLLWRSLYGCPGDLICRT